ncbi:hypothetical protein BOX15_Mlig003874g1 [Macrostomum lignano]|uniref:RCC1-like domain-containing protein n=2 Tax=Macrostomum lignano TaxID=282301 RepID=A0A267DY61_9PLAT|nr:hypothetical protein BOX15_Mlig003874g1 [Macrostomum lignano]
MTRSRKRAISETENNNNASMADSGAGGPARKTARADTAAAAGASSSGADSAAVDKVRLHFNSTPGQVLTLGEGDTGQLGLGDEVLGRKRPAKVDGLSNVVQAVAGGMHTVCLTADGVVYTFGCNDEQALGRSTSEDGSEYLPGQVGEGLPDPAEDPVVHISAGDSHTAAVTRTGRLYLWGTFRDSNGIIGLTRAKEVSARPIQLEFPEPGVRVAKTASGACHVVCLTRDGRVFTLGCGEQGQLGRVNERLAGAHGGRNGMQLFLGPREVRIRGSPYFTDVWAGAYVSFAKSAKKGAIYAWGLNNYYQLGTGDLENKFFPALATEFSGKQWREVSTGQHHTVALDEAGQVYSIGRGEYGRLGRGPDRQESSGRLEPIGGVLASLACRQVSCATACSFCVAETDGSAYAWGMGSNKQLGHGDEDEDAFLPGRIEGKQLEGVRVLSVSGGGQHTVMLVAPRAAKVDAPAGAVSAAASASAGDDATRPSAPSTASGVVSATPTVAITAPAAVSATPTAVSAAPAAVSATPAAVSAAPAAVSAAPAGVSAAPAAVSATPAAVSATPAAVSTAPAAVSATPAAVYTAPAAVSAAPAAPSAATALASAVPAIASAVTAVASAAPAVVSAAPSAASGVLSSAPATDASVAASSAEESSATPASDARSGN